MRICAYAKYLIEINSVHTRHFLCGLNSQSCNCASDLAYDITYFRTSVQMAATQCLVPMRMLRRLVSVNFNLQTAQEDKYSLPQVRVSEDITWETRCIAMLRANKTSTVIIHSWVDQRSPSTNLQWTLCRNHRSDRNTDSANVCSCCHCDSFLATEILTGLSYPTS
jgi:hypothetical protein